MQSTFAIDDSRIRIRQFFSNAVPFVEFSRVMSVPMGRARTSEARGAQGMTPILLCLQ